MRKGLTFHPIFKTKSPISRCIVLRGAAQRLLHEKIQGHIDYSESGKITVYSKGLLLTKEQTVIAEEIANQLQPEPPVGFTLKGFVDGHKDLYEFFYEFNEDEEQNIWEAFLDAVAEIENALSWLDSCKRKLERNKRKNILLQAGFSNTTSISIPPQP